MRSRWLAVPAALAIVSLFAACTVSVSGGVSGLAVAILSALAILASGTASSGCDCGYLAHDDDDDNDVPDVCLSWIPLDAGRDAEVTACLDAPYEPDADIGPCLEAPYEPDAGRDAGQSTCLDVAPCLEAPYDAGTDATLEPCLDVEIEPDASLSSLVDERARATEKLADRLPPDVLARLRRG